MPDKIYSDEQFAADSARRQGRAAGGRGHVLAMWLALGSMFGLLAGICVGASMHERLDARQRAVLGTLYDGWAVGEPMDASADEDAGYGMRIHRLTPMDVRFSIVPRARFEALEQAPSYGFALIDRRPCRIMVPDDWRVAYDAKNQVAAWLSDAFDDHGHDGKVRTSSVTDPGATLVHELLHCQIGSWHPGGAR